jgi:hypothetical protein
LNIIDSVASNHSNIATSRGLLAGTGLGGGQINLGGSAIHSNNVAFNVGANGTIFTYGNNQMDDNGPPVGALTPAPNGLD